MPDRNDALAVGPISPVRAGRIDGSDPLRASSAADVTGDPPKRWPARPETGAGACAGCG